MESGDRILADNYELREKLSTTTEFELWTALDIFSGPALVKIWPFGGSRPDETLRAAWNSELRNLLRLSSSPDAESRIVVVRRAGIDYRHRSFVLVMACPGTTPLDKVLQERQNVHWFKNINENLPRAMLWRGIRNLCLGLQQLHQYQMLHRNIAPASIFVDRDEGPESMRLGGFEWTIRLGETVDNTYYSRSQTSAVPNLPHSFESDWLAFAYLVAAILMPNQTPPCSSMGLEDISEVIERTNLLIASEKHLLARMLDPSPIARLSRPTDIQNRIDEIISILDRTPRLLAGTYLGLVVLLGPARELTRSIIESDPQINPLDIEAQRRFIESDLIQAKLVNSASHLGKAYMLIGNRLSYLIRENQDQPTAIGHWSLAFCSKDIAVRFIPDTDARELPVGLSIRAFTANTARQSDSIIRRDAISWNYFLPPVERRSISRERQRRFHDFFRITNQIELLFCDLELFPYEVVTRTVDGENDILEIQERERERECLDFAKPRDGLFGFLETVTAAEDKKGFDLVYLGSEESLMISPLTEEHYWKIQQPLDPNKKTIRLIRRRQGLAIPTRGFLRTYGMFGQVSLIRRRKQAIDRLQYHNYLLEAMQNPYFLYVDTGETQMPNKIDPAKIDAAKSAALRHLWRTRPIYALQGPPGTGKTTLVANLLGQIFQEDPVAQVLVSAQAHAAVDVLREKVNEDIFRDIAEDQRPMSIRLPKGRTDFQDTDPDSLTMVTLKLLERCEEKLNDNSPLSSEWQQVVHEALMGLRTGDLEGSAGDIRELVRRSASITYSTTTGGSLEELASITHTYDWSLIEEAGKAHGFDLALPLQTGHRWLLIGDQKQLAAYKYDNFKKALLELPRTVDLLMDLPERAGGLVDIELLQNWKAKKAMEATELRDLWVSWLPTFKRLFDNCQSTPTSQATLATTPLASMLSQQHRMHPTIGKLISEVFYDGGLESKATDKDHCFTVPRGIIGKALVWLNVGKLEPRGIEGLYTSPIEVKAITNFINALRFSNPPKKPYKLAILSPYRLQVHKLSTDLKDIYKYPPVWLEPLEEDETVARTVDSFQGGQADIVVVSLVRNNAHQTPTKALGFLQEDSRMNVLLPRAERLLVLVGNWSFFNETLRTVPSDLYQPFGRLKCAIQHFEREIAADQALMINAADLEVKQ